jgi:hypothetical protein
MERLDETPHQGWALLLRCCVREKKGDDDKTKAILAVVL